MSTDPAPEAPDPIRQLLGPSLVSARSLRMAHWAGICALAGAIAAVAIMIPPLISPKDDRAASVPEVTAADATSRPAPVATGSTSAQPSPSPTASRNRTAPPAATGPPGAGDNPSPGAGSTGPSRTTQRFSPVSVQAEDPDNQLGAGAATTSCATCDGGGRVRYLGELTVYFELPAAGARTVTVTYECGDGKRIIQISAGSQSWSFTVYGTSWETPKTFTFNANLPAGKVAFKFHNDGHAAPDIDKVTIS